MSDEEMMDEEEYDFEYEDEEEEDSEVVDVENEYYNAKALRSDDPEEALASFRKVVDMETEKGEWGFKALKHSAKLQFKLKKYDAMMKSYREMLTYIRSAVTRNASEKAINTILDLASSSAEMSLLERLYEATLQALRDTKNERLWFKTNLKLGSLWFTMGRYEQLQSTLDDLENSLHEDSGDNHRKGTQLLEVYSLKIQMYTAQKNTKELKKLYNKALEVRSGIPHPRILGTIRECGGKMHMHDREWTKAREDFFEAFKAYDEAGSAERIQCLKYLLVANMLSSGEIDPFEAPETKPYKADPEIETMTRLHSAYQTNDIKEFQKLLKSGANSVIEDPFIATYVEELLRHVRLSVLVELLRPFSKVSLNHIAKELTVKESVIRDLVSSLILDQRISGAIDDRTGVLYMGKNAKGTTQQAELALAQQLEKVEHAVLRRLP